MNAPKLLSAVAYLLLLPVSLVAAQALIYTYELPAEFTQGIAKMPLDRPEQEWTIWYDTDQVRPNESSPRQFK